MHGRIQFSTTEDLVEFLVAFTGKSTATFEVREVNGLWVLEFNGGH